MANVTIGAWGVCDPRKADLVPPTDLNENYSASIAALDASQKAPVVSGEPNTVIKAPAGSGKTTTLIDAVASYRYYNLNDRICTITFTKAASAEMADRLRKLGVTDVEVGTIHSWCRRELERLQKKYGFRLYILDDRRSKVILQGIIKEYMRLHQKIRSINSDVVFAYVMGNKRMEISDNIKRTFNAIEKRYTNYKKKNNLYDFKDYPQYLLDVLDAYGEDIDDVDALFVDEFQDVDDVQLEIFNRTKTAKKFYIGDPWQCIYAFRGANTETFTNLPEDFKRYKLDFNYRSYQEIIDYASTVYPLLESGTSISNFLYVTPVEGVKCTKGYGGEVYCFDKQSEGLRYVNGVATETAPCDFSGIFKSFLDKKPMILCRRNDQVDSIRKNYNYFDVNTVHQAKGLEYPNVVVIDSEISDKEDANIAYVAMTRAKDGLMVITWPVFTYAMEDYASRRSVENLL